MGLLSVWKSGSLIICLFLGLCFCWDFLFNFNNIFFALFYCGGLNKFGPHGHMCLNAWPIGSGNITRCDFVGGSVSLWRWALGSLMLKQHTVRHSVHFLLPVDQDVEFSAPSPAPCLTT